MAKADDDHIILPEDSIDQKMIVRTINDATPFSIMAPNLACNVVDAVGKTAKEFNSIGRQVWTGRFMKCLGEKIVR